jgi:hypothetical protein
MVGLLYEKSKQVAMLGQDELFKRFECKDLRNHKKKTGNAKQ